MEKKRLALKKLLEAVEKEIIRKPDRKALDRLSLFVGFQDWESFQEALHGETSADENYEWKREAPAVEPLFVAFLIHQRCGASP